MKSAYTIAIHFKPGADPATCLRSLEETVAPLVTAHKVTHLFPDESRSTVLRAMYTVYLSGGDADVVRAALEKIADVDLVHVSSERRAQ